MHAHDQQVIAQPDRPVPFTPQVQKLMQLQSDEEIKDADKSDTTFSAGSLQAALRAAGSVIAAIDAVVDGTHRNAFCCVRPPGHHAGANGLESDAVSCGFCLFNNVAIGALHALKERSSTVKKVAVIDFDVHHGNGTQAIFEGTDDPSAIFFFSIHLCACSLCLPVCGRAWAYIRACSLLTNANWLPWLQMTRTETVRTACRSPRPTVAAGGAAQPGQRQCNAHQLPPHRASTSSNSTPVRGRTMSWRRTSSMLP